MELDPNTICDIGHRTRERYRDPHGICMDVTADLIELLPDSVSPKAVRSYAVNTSANDDQQELHYFTALPVDEVIGVEPASNNEHGEFVFIDLSLDQFCEEFHREGRVDVSYGTRADIPEVLFLSPGDNRRRRYEEIEVIEPEHVLVA